MFPPEIEAFVRSVKAEDRPRARAARPGPPRRGRPGDASRALGGLLLPALADPATAAKAAELRKRVLAGHLSAQREAREAAAARSAERRDAVLAAAARRLQGPLAAAALPLDADAVPRWYVVAQPFLIWPTGLVLDDLQSVDLQSYVRFRVILDPGADASGSVRFYYYWTNPFPDPVFADLGVVASWNGYCDVYLNGGPFAEDVAGAYVEAKLELLEVWAENAAYTTVDQHVVFSASLQDGGLYSGFAETAAATDDGWLLSAPNVLIPGGRTVVFTLTVDVSASVYDDGGASIDYSTAGYLFGSPAAVVTVTGRVVSP